MNATNTSAFVKHLLNRFFIEYKTRECLRHDISPFIIEDLNRPEYLEALKAYRQDGTVTALTTLFQKEQEFYFNQCEYFFAE